MKHWHVRFEENRSDLQHVQEIWAEHAILAIVNAAIQQFPKEIFDLSFITKASAVEID